MARVPSAGSPSRISSSAAPLQNVVPVCVSSTACAVPSVPAVAAAASESRSCATSRRDSAFLLAGESSVMVTMRSPDTLCTIPDICLPASV